ncbi:MAG TPA: hypothetical protein ENN68_03305 [Methanomicrobia archaeon]|nr:hypothetical protein [Methanomicrobia archaeon]
MRRYRLIAPLVFLVLIALGIFILFNTGSDFAITIILLFIPVMIAVSFLVRYLVTVRKRGITERVMERDVMRIADRYGEERRILYDFEHKYGISSREFMEELVKVKEALLELGCEVNGRTKIDRVKLRKVVFADIEWVKKLFEGIKDRHEVVLYSRMMDKCSEYLKHLKELEAAGYLNLHGQIERLESKLRPGDRIIVDSLELSLFMNDVGSTVEEALQIALQDAHRLEAVGREIAKVDTTRIRTDIKIVEHSIEHGNYENAARVLKSMIERLIVLLQDAFDQYKAEVLDLTIAVSELLDTSEDKAELDALKRGIEACMSPSEIAKLREYGDALIRKSVATLGTVYHRIFELEAEIAEANPTTEVYPVEYWSKNKMDEVEELKWGSTTEVKSFIRRYRLLAADAYSRLLYDAERLKRIKEEPHSAPSYKTTEDDPPGE